jgi:integrase
LKRRLQREQTPKSPFVFTSEPAAHSARPASRTSSRPPPIGLAHPHMLRHACGFKLANDGHDTRAPRAYLGHKNIQHTVRYGELSLRIFGAIERAEATCRVRQSPTGAVHACRPRIASRK